MADFTTDSITAGALSRDRGYFPSYPEVNPGAQVKDDDCYSFHDWRIDSEISEPPASNAFRFDSRTLVGDL